MRASSKSFTRSWPHLGYVTWRFSPAARLKTAYWLCGSAASSIMDVPKSSEARSSVAMFAAST